MEGSKRGCPRWAIFRRASAPSWVLVCSPLAFGEGSFACSGPHVCAMCKRKGHWAVLGQSPGKWSSPDLPGHSLLPTLPISIWHKPWYSGFYFIKKSGRTSLALQWLRLRASTAGGTGSIQNKTKQNKQTNKKKCGISLWTLSVASVWGPRGRKIAVNVRTKNVKEKVLETPLGSRAQTLPKRQPHSWFTGPGLELGLAAWSGSQATADTGGGSFPEGKASSVMPAGTREPHKPRP